MSSSKLDRYLFELISRKILTKYKVWIEVNSAIEDWVLTKFEEK